MLFHSRCLRLRNKLKNRNDNVNMKTGTTETHTFLEGIRNRSILKVIFEWELPSNHWCKMIRKHINYYFIYRLLYEDRFTNDLRDWQIEDRSKRGTSMIDRYVINTHTQTHMCLWACECVREREFFSSWVNSWVNFFSKFGTTNSQRNVCESWY